MINPPQLLRDRWIVRKMYKPSRSPYWYLNIRDNLTGLVRRRSTKHTDERLALESIDGVLDVLEGKRGSLVAIAQKLRGLDTATREIHRRINDLEWKLEAAMNK